MESRNISFKYFFSHPRRSNIIYYYGKNSETFVLDKKKAVKVNNELKVSDIEVDNFIKIFVVIFLIITILLSIKDLLRITGYPLGEIFAAMKRYDYLDKFSSTNVGFGSITNLFKTISIAFTFWFLFILINNYIYSKRVNVLDLIIVILGIASTLTTGGRNYMISIILAGCAMCMMLYYSKHSNKKRKISIRAKILIVLIPILGLWSFPKMTELVGRSVNTSSMYYLAIYCGAPIKNLDTYLQEFQNKTDIKHQNITFRNLIVWYNAKFGSGETYKFDQPFRYIGNYQLGNVYTLFYSYVYDYGYAGVIILTSVMAFIVQFIYEKSKSVKKLNKPNMWYLIYGYMFGYILLAYFNNKFYERVFTTHFIELVILWIFFNGILLKIRFKPNNKIAPRNTTTPDTIQHQNEKTFTKNDKKCC